MGIDSTRIDGAIGDRQAFEIRAIERGNDEICLAGSGDVEAQDIGRDCRLARQRTIGAKIHARRQNSDAEAAGDVGRQPPDRFVALR